MLTDNPTIQINYRFYFDYMHFQIFPQNKFAACFTQKM